MYIKINVGAFLPQDRPQNGGLTCLPFTQLKDKETDASDHDPAELLPVEAQLVLFNCVLATSKQ